MRVLFDCLSTYNPYKGMNAYCQLLAKYFRKLAPLSLDNPDIHFFLNKEHTYWPAEKVLTVVQNEDCANSGQEVSDHLVEVNELVPVGSGAKRNRRYLIHKKNK